MASFKWKPHGAHLAGAVQESSRYVYIHPLNASLCVRSRWRNHILTASARDLHLHTTDMNDNIHRPGQKARSCDPRGQKPGLGWVRDVELSECMDEILQKLWALVKNIIFPNSPQAWLLYFSIGKWWKTCDIFWIHRSENSPYFPLKQQEWILFAQCAEVHLWSPSLPSSCSYHIYKACRIREGKKCTSEGFSRAFFFSFQELRL